MFVIKEGTPAEKIGEGTDPNTIKAIESYLGKSGYVVRTADSEKSFLESHTQQQIDAAFSQRNTQLEQSIEKLTGIKRDASEKHYDFLNRAVSTRLNEVDTLKAKITEWEKKGGAGSEQIINDLKNQLASAQQTYQQTITEKEKALADLQGQFFGTRLNGAWEQSVGNMRPKFIENQFLNSELEMRKAKFFGEHVAEESNGQIVYKNKDGKILISTKDGKPKSTDEIVDDLYKDLIDKKRAAGGAGSGGGGNGDDGQGGGTPPANWKDAQIPVDRIKTGVQLHDYMVKDLKMDMTTKEFGEAFKHWMTTHKLRIK